MRWACLILPLILWGLPAGAQVRPAPESFSVLIQNSPLATVPFAAGDGIPIVQNGTIHRLSMQGGAGGVALANLANVNEPDGRNNLGLGATSSVTFNGLTLGTPLAVASGGTGVTASTGTGSVVLSTSPTLVTPALGTPSSGIATNLTGTAAGLTAGTVTTNANLSGPITSIGNVTSVGSQTGTGSNFVMDTSPTLITPNIGAATASSLTLTGPIFGKGRTVAGTSYMLAATDCGTRITFLNAATSTVTAIANPISGTQTCKVELQQEGSGFVVMAAGAGTLVSYACPIGRTRGQYSIMELFVQPNNPSEWNIAGQCL